MAGSLVLFVGTVVVSTLIFTMNLIGVTGVVVLMGGSGLIMIGVGITIMCYYKKKQECDINNRRYSIGYR